MMEMSEEDPEKTQVLIHFDLPLFLNSISLPKQASVPPNLNFHNTFYTFQQTQQIPHFENPQSFQSPESIIGIIKLLNTQNFQDIELIGKGGYGLVFKARNLNRNEIVALKLQISFNEDESGGQEEANMGKFLSKKVAENLKSKTLSIYSKICLKDPNGKYVLTIIEMELAKYSLRDLITRKRQEKKAFTSKELRKICFDLIENLYYIHLNNIAHFDIKPENVLFINMNESYILADFGISEEIPLKNNESGQFLTPIKGTIMYMSPKMREACWGMKPAIFHDPFKSDVFSLGLVFFELNTVASLTEEQFQLILKNRDENFWLEVSRNPLFLTFNYLFQEDECYRIPDALSFMLSEKEEDRKDILEICLICDLIEPILSGISTPLSQRFLPNISNPPINLMEVMGYTNAKEYERELKMITYALRPVVYIGDYKGFNGDANSNIRYYKKDGKGILLRFEGTGTINISDVTKTNYKDFLIFEGFWKEDVPHKYGTMKFNDKGTVYEGGFDMGRFEGKGSLSIRGMKQKNGSWTSNLSEEFKYSLCLQFVNDLEPGYYKFKSEESKVFIKRKLKSTNPEKNFFFDLTAVGVEAKLAVFLVELLRNRLKFGKTVFREKIESPMFDSCFDVIEFYGKDSVHENEPRKLVVLLKPWSNNVKGLKSSQTFGRTPISAADILRSQVMQDVKTLKMGEVGYGDEFFIDIVNNKNMGCLQNLKITRNEKISDFLFENSMILPNIVSLDLSGTKISNDSLRLFANRVKFLENLALVACRNITSEGIKFLMSSKGLKNLKTLNLDSCLINDEAMEYFGKSPFVKNLEKLNLCHNSKLTDNSLRSISISENSKSLTHLDLSYLHLSDVGLGYIQNSKNLINLQSLDLTKCSKLSVEALMKICPIFKNLKVFKLGKSKANVKLAPKLAKIKGLAVCKLKKGFKITDEFIEEFTNSAGKGVQLKSISLGYTPISDRTIQETLCNPVYEKLEKLKLAGCNNLKDSALTFMMEHGDFLKNLMFVDFSDSLIGDEFLVSLSKNPKEPIFISLKMNDCKKLTSKGMEIFFSISSLQKTLKWTYFRNCEGFNSFTQLPFFSNLEYVDIKGCKNPDFPNFSAFLENFPINKKFKIDMRNIEFPKEAILKLRKMKSLVLQIFFWSVKTFISKSNILSLTYVESFEKTVDTPKNFEELTDEVLKSFSNSNCLKNLLELNLSKCYKISDQGFALIMNSPNCRNLEKIDLSYTNLTDFSMNALAACPSASCLQFLILYKNDGITFPGIIDTLKIKSLIRLNKFDARIKQKPPNINFIEEFIKTIIFLQTITQISLDFSEMKFPENLIEFRGVFGGVKKIAGLKEFDVNFANCKLNEELICEFMGICEGLAEMENFKLEFLGSVVKNKGCDAIAKCLQTMKKLKKAEIGLKK